MKQAARMPGKTTAGSANGVAEASYQKNACKIAAATNVVRHTTLE